VKKTIIAVSIAVIAAVAIQALIATTIATTAFAGSVTVNGPAINRMQQASNSTNKADRDNEGRICSTCHGLHKITDKQISPVNMSKPSLPGTSSCTYKKMKFGKK